MKYFWIFLIVISIVSFIFVIRKKIRPFWKKILLVLIILTLIIFSIIKLILPFYSPLKPTGDLEYQTEVVYFNHKTNFKNFETDPGIREIPVKLWSPKNLTSEKFPVIVFSHGSFGVYDSNETLFQELASRGYIVASMNHPYHSFFSKKSDGKTIYVSSDFFKEVISTQGSENLQDTKEKFDNWMKLRGEDFNFIIESLENYKGDNNIINAIDFKKFYVMGHSLGGSVVLNFGRNFPEKTKGVISLEAPFFGDIISINKDSNTYEFVKDEYPIPILHIYSDALWNKMEDITTYEENVRYIKDSSEKFTNVHISGTGHLGLTDLRLVSPFLTNLFDGGLNTTDSEIVLKEINKNVLEFLVK